MPAHYQAYGLTISSEIELPELPQVSTLAHPADLSITRDPSLTAAPTGEDWVQLSPFAWTAPTAFMLLVPDVAWFLVENGQTIRVAPVGDIDMASVRVFLLGSAIGALLFQRGYLVLHGNAVDMGDACMLCLGVSGAGKSTLAAAFAARGYSVLADDVVAINNVGQALPGIPRIKIWRDAAERLCVDTGSLDRIRPQMEKFNLPLPQTLVSTPRPVKWVFLLGKHEKPGFELTHLNGIGRFGPLMANTYRRRFMEGMRLNADHLAQCGRFAGLVQMAQVRRPETGFDIDGLVDLLLEDMSKVPSA
ncbi:hypothetical protein M3N55_10670 [Roseibaca sp. V10]|uniref:Hpr(Ser) kinase/phosphatase n=1 Tax=Roseinatronobacter domitianus TaxID=2940293 RepID=A0ABT0M2V4_9RHOB|nr:hypothetical protein [Roseibaca domitiana]MCL1629196.1 hypothetical protein [Roseibaca domitiana]